MTIKALLQSPPPTTHIDTPQYAHDTVSTFPFICANLHPDQLLKITNYCTGFPATDLQDTGRKEPPPPTTLFAATPHHSTSSKPPFPFRQWMCLCFTVLTSSPFSNLAPRTPLTCGLRCCCPIVQFTPNNNTPLSSVFDRAFAALSSEASRAKDGPSPDRHTYAVPLLVQGRVLVWRRGSWTPGIHTCLDPPLLARALPLRLGIALFCTDATYPHSQNETLAS